MTDFEIRKVANGVMVLPWRGGRMPGECTPNDAIHVFRTWAQASAWIRKQLEKA